MRDDILDVRVGPLTVRSEPALHRYFQAAIGASGEVAEGQPVNPLSLFGPTSAGYPDPVELIGGTPATVLMAGAEHDIARPPRLGEELTVRGRVAEVRERTSATGRSAVITIENTFTDGAGALVMVERLTLVERLPDGG